MKRRSLATALLLSLTLLAPASAGADDPTPGPVVTAPPVVAEPTQPAVVYPTAPPVVVVPSPDVYQAPVQVSKESHATERISQPAVEPTAPASQNPQVSEPVSPPVQGQQATQSPPPPAQPTPTAATVSVSSGTTLPPQTSPTQDTSSTSVAAQVAAAPVSAAAPSQLVCHGVHHDTSGPFLVSPFANWTEINSFVDHDYPDYTIDGRIVIANGLTASASAGQESDFFPAYWSESIRQYINYDGHNGYDFGISYQPVLAAADGTVTYAGWNSSDPSVGYGQMILIDHHNGYETLYGHLSQLDVRQGDKVTAGEQIGISGTTGNSTGPHLHFSVFHNCQVTDPYGWTGRGPDPLKAFDGETSQYLWLPGHDPLILNPPPGWPTFPAGLHVSWSHLSPAVRAMPTVTPIDRLLLLDLPGTGRQVSPGAILSQTQSSIDQEYERLEPYLGSLRQSGLVDSYRFVPAAGAIWLRGTAGASQLEALPGVASISGGSSRDLAAATAGLSHALLLDSAAQAGPSLWPVGFRSALDAWRPVVHILIGSPTVMGSASPGERLHVRLRQGRSTVGSTAVTADASTGGFVAVFTGAGGSLTPCLPGDTVSVVAGSRRVDVPVVPLTVHAHMNAVSGRAPAGSSIAAQVVPKTNSVADDPSLVTANESGSIHLATPARLAPGSIALETLTEAGNSVTAAAPLAGLRVQLGTSIVRGWVVGNRPYLSIRRHGHVLLSLPVHAAADGSFASPLEAGGQPVVLAPGDVLSIGSRRHRHAITLPRLRAGTVEPWVDGSADTVIGPPTAPVVTIDEGRSVVSGTVPAHAAVRAVLLSSTGKQLAAGTAIPSPGGRFSLTLTTPGGETESPSASTRLTIWVGDAPYTVALPVLRGRLVRNPLHLTVTGLPAEGVTVRVKRAHEADITKAMTPMAGALDVDLRPLASLRSFRSITVRVPLSGSIELDRRWSTPSKQSTPPNS